jgi:hypothetical protein
VTLKVKLLPPPSVSGVAGALTENSLPVVRKASTVSFQVRLLVSTTVFVELDPTATGPKETMEGLADRGSLVSPVPPN